MNKNTQQPVSPARIGQTPSRGSGTIRTGQYDKNRTQPNDQSDTPHDTQKDGINSEKNDQFIPRR